MNVKKILTQAIQKLEKFNIKTANLDAEILLFYTIKKSREFILTHSEHKLTESQITNFNSLIKKRSKGNPVAYLMGHKEFYGLDFLVNKDVLIPRPETELMIDEVLNFISHISRPMSFIDIGTGSGCIIISLIKQLLTFNFQLSTFNFFATDISKNALVVARKNAKKHKVKIKFLEGNLLEPFFENHKLSNPKNPIIITANLPYLTPSQLKNSLSIKKEPKIALVAGSDGLKYYEELFKQIKLLVTSYPSNSAGKQLQITIFCEIDPQQKIKIGTLIKKELPNSSFQIKKDLNGHSRLVIVKF